MKQDRIRYLEATIEEQKQVIAEYKTKVIELLEEDRKRKAKGWPGGTIC